MPTADETEIQQLMRELTEAWNRGDVNAYGARYLADGTFTNVNGGFYVGRDEFDRRHDEVFRGPFKGTTLTMTTRRLRFLRPDLAVIDVDTGLFGAPIQPPGVQAGADGALRACLLMVLVKENEKWWIAAYHNVWRSAQGNWDQKPSN
jgi:uncharacterized protein (TIGR02246 family)